MERVNTFKYLGATLAEDGDLDAEMTHRIQSGWKKLEEGIGDSVRQKNKFESQGESSDSDSDSDIYFATT